MAQLAEHVLHERPPSRHENEGRNVAIYLAGRLRRDRLKEIGEALQIGRYSTVSSIVERMKVRIGSDETLRKRVDRLISTIQMSQEQTPLFSAIHIKKMFRSLNFSFNNLNPNSNDFGR